MWLSAENIDCVHGFSTRHGGISPAPFDSLNLGGSLDDPTNIRSNRSLALQQLDLSENNLCLLRQVHGTTVCEAQPGFQEGDALVTNFPDHILAVSIADCYPILFYDQKNKVCGAAHAGWRGTLGGVAAGTIQAMKKLGAQTENISVAIGQGISQKKFAVGREVIGQFMDAGFPTTCIVGNTIDLVKSNLHVLQQNNILDKNIWTMNRCTFEDDFFSHRRDNGVTGRMWAIISMC